MTGRLVLMGSGELAPTMVSTHRSNIKAVDARTVVMLDTPFGFQENVDLLTEKIVEFFDTSLVIDTEVASLRTADESPATVERMLASVRNGRYIFAGPGSPSYALAIWQDVGLGSALTEVITQGGAVVLSSAAALTAGIKTIPVYEIYKAGVDPYWLDGMDLGSAFGLPITVVPHWNNQDGGNHDTSRCFIGRRRLAMLEPGLDHGIVGIDEHTAATIDFGSGTLSVSGASTVVLRGSDTVILEAGSSISLDEARGILSRGRSATTTEVTVPASTASFTDALDEGDVDAAAEAALAIEDDVAGGSEDRSRLRRVITELAEAARSGLVDPRTVVGGYVDLLLELRAAAREDKRWDESDAIRDGLAQLGVEVRDTPDGVEWELE